MDCEMEIFGNFRRYTIRDPSFIVLIEVEVTSCPAHVRSWVNLMMQSPYWLEETDRGQGVMVGLSVQWTNRPYLRVEAPADTLQLCIEFRCLMVQLKQAEDVPIELRDLLNNAHCIFVGVGNGSTARRLRNSIHHLEMREGYQISESMRLIRSDLDLNCQEYDPPESFAYEIFGMTTEPWRADVINGNWAAELSREQVLLAYGRVYSGWLVARFIYVYVQDFSS